MSIYFEVDGPYRAMVLPPSTEEGKLLKKHTPHHHPSTTPSSSYDGSTRRAQGLRGEAPRRAQADQGLPGAGVRTAPSCRATTLDVLRRRLGGRQPWLDVIDTHGEELEDEELFELVSEQKSMSRTLEEYGAQKSTAITVARRLAEFLGDADGQGRRARVQVHHRRQAARQAGDRARDPGGDLRGGGGGALPLPPPLAQGPLDGGGGHGDPPGDRLELLPRPPRRGDPEDHHDPRCDGTRRGASHTCTAP